MHTVYKIRFIAGTWNYFRGGDIEKKLNHGMHFYVTYWCVYYDILHYLNIGKTAIDRITTYLFSSWLIQLN